MRTITLGSTGIVTPQNAFGALPIQRVSEQDAVALLRLAFEGGMTFFDTARAYSNSEERVGLAFEGMRDKVAIATKTQARTPEAFWEDLETSLRLLRTDHVDLYQFHCVDQCYRPGDGTGMYECMLKAKEQGKIAHIGVTAHMAGVFEKALTMDWVETVMFPYNIVETQGEALMQKCREQNVGFICMKPMAGGALEDARLAMRFIGRNENVSVVIPGMYDVREIDQNIEAIEDASPLTEAERAQLDVIRRELGTQFCRRCNYCQPCTAGIAISGIFVLEGYLNRYGLGDWAKQRYAAMGKKAGDCVGCGACEKRCPYQLPIRQMLARCKGEFGA